MKVEHIQHNGETVAIIFYHQPITPGVHFYVKNNSSLQVGKQLRLKGEEINPHRHLPVNIQKDETLKEVLYIERGKVKINFYNDQWEKSDSRILNRGDMILLIKGGHGFEMLKETMMVEIKEGPYNPASTQKRD